MAARIVNIALAQTSPVLGKISDNLDAAVRLTEQAAAEGADLILFPELCFTGYQLELLGKEILRLSDEWNEQIHDTLSRCARASRINIVAGLCEQSDGSYYNTACIYDRQGRRAGSYRKLFSFATEGSFFAKGSSLPVFDLDFGRVGVLICYDAGFPETARSLSLSGAEVLLIPAAWRIQERRAWDLDVTVRAMENQVYSVGVNQTGQYGDLHLFGGSLACGPAGEVLTRLSDDRPELGFCRMDLGVLETLHRRPGYRYDLQRSKVIKGGTY